MTVMVIIEISDDSDAITRPVCDRRKGSYVVFPYLLSCFKFPNGNVQSAERPCKCKTYKTGHREAGLLFGKNHNQVIGFFSGFRISVLLIFR